METWSDSLAVWLTAIGTIGATVVAVYLAYRSEQQNKQKPKLSIGFRFFPPDCTLLTESIKSAEAPNEPKRIDAFWFRGFVKNSGRGVARDVEVIIHDILIRTGDTWKPIPDFISSNLWWTHLPRHNAYLPMILPGTSKNFEIGCILKPKLDKTWFEFKLTIVPSYKYNVMPPGEYKFTVTVGASNAKPVHQQFELKVTGDWFESIDSMFELGVSIKIVS